MDEVRMTKTVGDLGSCAYLMMHGFKVKGYNRFERAYEFDILEKDDAEFEEKQNDYLNSEFHRFDACLMSLKKRWKS